MGRAGRSRRNRGSRFDRLFALILLALISQEALARPTQKFAIPASTLDVAIIALAHQSGADIISTEPGLHDVSTKPFDGYMPVAKALDRLLAGSSYRAIAIDGHSFRIVAVTPEKLKAAISLPPPAVAAPEVELVVTASKQQVALLRFPGSIIHLSGSPDRLPIGNADVESLSRTMAVLQNTDLGKGRNKLFIRGIADSSFNGATQSSSSIYFGDMQLGYSGAQPSLALYDINSIEIMEGPQGTIYGSGAIGGILRITPNPVDLDQATGTFFGGLTATAGGGVGHDLGAIANLPISADKIGIRLVAYQQRDGGYIDDLRRHLTNINPVDTWGGRLALRVDPGDGWQINIGAAAQRISGADGQYTQTNVEPLARRTFLAQPYFSDLDFGTVILSKQWDNGLKLTSVTGLSSVRTTDNFDATGSFGTKGATLYNDNGDNLLISHETRVSRSSGNGWSWVAGVALLYDRDAQTRTLGKPDAPVDIVGVTNVTKSAAAFGEATLPVGGSLLVTAGARLTTTRTDGMPTADTVRNRFVPGLATTRIDPTLAVSWRLAPRLAAFGRFQTGYRTGGIAVARGVGRVANFQPDSIMMGEIGLRRERPAATGISFSSAVSFAHWQDIQADLISARGQPYTANIGSADIFGFEGSMDWVPFVGLGIRGYYLYTENRVHGPLAMSSAPNDRRLPETPPFAANLEARYQWTSIADLAFHVSADTRYVGRSVLGTSNFLDISQGRYASLRIGGGLRWRNIDASLTVDNVTNTAGNRFAFGNPFTFGARRETTPLQPRNVRIGIGVSW